MWEFDKYDDEEKSLLFYSDREIRRMVRKDINNSCVGLPGRLVGGLG